MGICSKWSTSKQAIISTDNGLLLNGQHAICWTKDDIIYWRIYAPIVPGEFSPYIIELD